MTESVFLSALIVEADLMVRAHIIERLSKHSIACIEADDGLMALEKLEDHEIDFVLSDVHMKKIDGIQFIEIVHRSHKDIPVFVTINSKNEETIISAFRAGAINVIKKGEKLDELENIVLPVTDLIEKRKSRKFEFKSVRYFTEELSIINDPALIPITVEHLLKFLDQSKYADRLTGLEVALYEMIANAIEHGNLAISSKEKEEALSENRYNELLWERRNHPAFKSRLVKIKLNYNPRQLTIAISDEGTGFNVDNFKAVTQENMLAQCGRGILMSRMYCDEIMYNKKGNTATLVLRSETEPDKEGIVSFQSSEFPDPHILIVDSNPQILRHISNLLHDIGYTFGYIAHSHHLFSRLEEESFDLILLDVNMPKTDGLALLKELKSHTILRRLPVIMLTSDKNDRLMAECFANGAEDFIVKPVNKLALQCRVNSILTQRESFKKFRIANEKLELLNSQLQDQYDILKKTQGELNEKHLQIEEDIRLAQRIQKNILSPEQELSFLKTAVVFRPHSIVSGDFHFGETDQSGNFNVFLGDATGHGVSAAFLTMMVRMALGMTDFDLSPDEVVRGLNRQLADCVPRGDHMTGIMLKISPDGQLVGCNAGGPPCLLISDDKPDRLVFANGGQALGMFGEERIPFQTETLELKPRDKLILFTDGIIEWRNNEGLPFGLNALREVVSQWKHEPIDKTMLELSEAVIRFASLETQHDDVTLMGIEFKG